MPAFCKLQDYVRAEYVPRTRLSVAASGLPDGSAYYALLVREQTSTDLGVDEIHGIGLKEVARLCKAIEHHDGVLSSPARLTALARAITTSTSTSPNRGPSER